MKYKFKEELSKSQCISSWVTSMGPYKSTEVIITTTKIDNKWCISDILWNDTIKKLIF